VARVKATVAAGATLSVAIYQAPEEYENPPVVDDREESLAAVMVNSTGSPISYDEVIFTRIQFGDYSPGNAAMIGLCYSSTSASSTINETAFVCVECVRQA